MKALYLIAAAALFGAWQDATIFGIGLESCASAMEVQRQTERRAWILGFWSGLNAPTGGQVGEQSDALGLIGEVELYCRNHPSEKFAQAIYNSYFDMKLKEP